MKKNKGPSSDVACLIYTMGKVGSSSLEVAIPGSYHLHTLYNNPPNPPHWAMRNRGRCKFVIFARSILKRLYLLRYKRIDIITVVRSPIDRNISMFFQALPFWMAEAQSGLDKTQYSSREEGLDVLVNAFNDVFNHDYPLCWFDKEIKRFTGIDVFSEGFDHDKGMKIYAKGKFRLLVVQMDQLNNLGSEIESFVNMPITLVQENVGLNKWYSDAYKNFKRSYIPPQTLRAKIESSEYYKMFYKR